MEKSVAGINKIAIDTIRTLAVDAIQKANSGHPGMAIGAAPMAYAIYDKMTHNPKNPDWQGRDRFVLSAGHASALLYALLHLHGYDISIDDIKAFRQFGSKTPGHPELTTPGVEAGTGPLGQGFAMAVGMAMAEAYLATQFNKNGYKVFDNYTYVLMGDGCMMEGAASEAASMAGTFGLGKLIAVYDSNRITIEGSTDATFTEDVATRFMAYGFQVIEVADGEDVERISTALDEAKACTERPSLIIVSTNIGHGTPKEGMASAHGEPLGEDNIAAMKDALNWKHPAFHVPDELYEYFAKRQREHMRDEEEYYAMLESYKQEYPEMAVKLEKWLSGYGSGACFELEKLFATVDKNMATRAASGDLLNRLFSEFGIDNLFGGSADLGPSNKTILKSSGFFAKNEYNNANVHFGVRELAMAAACNGIALYGGIRAFCATFMVFSDYLKPALRMSALMELPVLYIMTHDSIGVGEDGATHHPVEQISTIRSIPNTMLFRPADYNETVAGYMTALSYKKPVVLSLSRQDLPQLAETGRGALRGAYILRDCKGEPDVILMATGSEVRLIVEAADMLSVRGVSVRVVSMPCLELFDAQPDSYREQVLPKHIRARVAVEAATGFGWHKYTGDCGELVTMDTFGASAPASVLFDKFGFTAENVVKAALISLEKTKN